MDNFYEVVILDDPAICEREKPRVVKTEVFTPKLEKNSFSELPCMTGILSTMKKFSPEGPKLSAEKQKIKQFMQSRSEIHQIESKTMQLKKPGESKDFDRINISKVPFLPLLSIRTNAIEELYKEIKEYKQNIVEIEERNKVNQQCIEIGKMKIQDLEDRFNRLKKKAGLGNNVAEIREELQVRLKNVQKNWNLNVKILKRKIFEMEEEAKSLGNQCEGIKNEIFRKRVQQKNLTKNLNENSSNSEIGFHSCDILNSSTQLKTVLRTPSWNSLAEN